MKGEDEKIVSRRGMVLGRGKGKQRAPPPRKKSAYTTDVYFGTVFRPNTPNVRSSLCSPERAVYLGGAGGAPPKKKFWIRACVAAGRPLPFKIFWIRP